MLRSDVLTEMYHWNLETTKICKYKYPMADADIVLIKKTGFDVFQLSKRPEALVEKSYSEEELIAQIAKDQIVILNTYYSRLDYERHTSNNCCCGGWKLSHPSHSPMCGKYKKY